MAVRDGMSDILDRARRLIDDSGATVWTDQELQNILDEHKLHVHREPLDMEKTMTSGTAYVYKIFHSRHDNFEAGGTAYFQVEDTTGTQRGTADYTADYLYGQVTMVTDQAGTALYLTGWSYDLNGAAAQCWRERASKVASYYDVDVDGHRLTRSQWFRHCRETAEFFAQQARAQSVRVWTSGVSEYR